MQHCAAIKRFLIQGDNTIGKFIYLQYLPKLKSYLLTLTRLEAMALVESGTSIDMSDGVGFPEPVHCDCEHVSDCKHVSDCY